MAACATEQQHFSKLGYSMSVEFRFKIANTGYVWYYGKLLEEGYNR